MIREIIVDVTMLLDGDGPPHSIFHLVAQTVLGLSDAARPIGFIRYHAQQERFHQIQLPPSLLPDLTALVGTSRARLVTAPATAPTPTGRNRLAGLFRHALPHRPRLPRHDALHQAAESVCKPSAGADPLIAAGRRTPHCGTWGHSSRSRVRKCSWPGRAGAHPASPRP